MCTNGTTSNKHQVDQKVFSGLVDVSAVDTLDYSTLQVPAFASSHDSSNHSFQTDCEIPGR